MSKTTELAIEPKEQNEVATLDTGVVTPMSMLQSARQQGASLEQMQQLMDMQFKWEENEAKKAYFKAVAEFKAEEILVAKDRKNNQYNSRYTSKGNLVNTVNPILSKHGLSANWKIEQGEVITVSCVLSHSQGHSESVSMSAPPDTSGGERGKNPIQQIKSTITYLEIVTFEAVTGVASHDDPGDDDGNGANSNDSPINATQIKALEKLIEEKEADKPAFLYHFGIENLEELPVSKFTRAKKMLEAKK